MRNLWIRFKNYLLREDREIYTHLRNKLIEDRIEDDKLHREAWVRLTQGLEPTENITREIYSALIRMYSSPSHPYELRLIHYPFPITTLGDNTMVWKNLNVSNSQIPGFVRLVVFIQTGIVIPV